MNCIFKYRKIDASLSLENYAKDRIEGVARFLLKDGKWEVEISKNKEVAQIKIKVLSPWGFFSALGKSHDYYISVDLACDKLITQIKKKKNQLQYHKKPHKSKKGRLENLNEFLEYFPETYKKTGNS